MSAITAQPSLIKFFWAQRTTCKKFCLSIVVVLAGLISLPFAHADIASFGDCISRMKVLARSEGITDRTVNQVLDKVKHIPRVIELDRRQPEFTQTFAGYFSTRISDERVQRCV